METLCATGLDASGPASVLAVSFLFPSPPSGFIPSLPREERARVRGLLPRSLRVFLSSRFSVPPLRPEGLRGPEGKDIGVLRETVLGVLREASQCLSVFLSQRLSDF
jgi:hypothetical protein